LRTIRIPDSVKEIKSSAFSENRNLTDANIPSGIIEIGLCAFKNCFKLSNLTIPASIKSIRWRGSAFEETSLTLATRRRLKELGNSYDGISQSQAPAQPQQTVQQQQQQIQPPSQATYQSYIRNGNAAYWKKDYDNAIADFTQAIQIDPNSSEAYDGRYRPYLDKGD